MRLYQREGKAFLQNLLLLAGEDDRLRHLGVLESDARDELLTIEGVSWGVWMRMGHIYSIIGNKTKMRSAIGSVNAGVDQVMRSRGNCRRDLVFWIVY